VSASFTITSSSQEASTNVATGVTLDLLNSILATASDGALVATGLAIQVECPDNSSNNPASGEYGCQCDAGWIGPNGGRLDR